MIGCTPAACAVTENSSAANMLLVSVTATAGMPDAAQSFGRLLSRTAPSRSEYSLCRRRWMNRGVLVMQAV